MVGEMSAARRKRKAAHRTGRFGCVVGIVGDGDADHLGDDRIRPPVAVRIVAFHSREAPGGYLRSAGASRSGQRRARSSASESRTERWSRPSCSRKSPPAGVTGSKSESRMGGVSCAAPGREGPAPSLRPGARPVPASLRLQPERRGGGDRAGPGAVSGRRRQCTVRPLPPGGCMHRSTKRSRPRGPGRASGSGGRTWRSCSKQGPISCYQAELSANQWLCPMARMQS